MTYQHPLNKKVDAEVYDLYDILQQQVDGHPWYEISGELHFCAPWDRCGGCERR